MANLSFDATNVAPSDDFSPIPAGDYLAVITESEVKPTKAGTGSYLALTFEITEGPSKSRKQWANLNLQNPNPKAVEIAQRELSAICHAAGKLQVFDSQELHYKPMIIRVDIEQSEGYSPRNVIKAYKKYDGAAATPAAGGNPFAQPSQSAAASTASPQPAAGATPASPSDGAPFWANQAA